LSLQTDPAYGSALLAQWVEQVKRPDIEKGDQLLRLYDLLVSIIVEVTDSSGLQFHTLFTRMAYLGTIIKMPPGLLYNTHLIRRQIFQWIVEDAKEIDHHLALIGRVGADLIGTIYKCNLSAKQESFLVDRSIYFQPETKEVEHLQHCRAEVLSIDRDLKEMTVLPDDASQEISVLYEVTGKNDLFRSTVSIIENYFSLPVAVSLIDIEVLPNGKWVPAAIVLMPDYLMDVTAVSDSLKHDGVQTLSYILRKFLPISRSKPILVGNIVNYFLDELISNPSISLSDLRKNLFKMAPLSFSAMDDRELRDLFQELSGHFTTLYQLANGGFQQQRIDPEKSILEPTFYSNKYGLQGRLDLFYTAENGREGAIVELKSGKPFMPNRYGLNQSHYLQTLLYDMLIESVYNGFFKPTSYILYSQQSEQPLRFAPVIKTQQYEALAARNELIGIEWQLAGLSDRTDVDENLLAGITTKDYPGLYGFQLRDVMEYEQTYHGLSGLEKRYFLAFTGMIAREHQLAKTGLAGREGMEGQAALWQKSPIQKEQAFELLKALKIIENQTDCDDPILELERTQYTNPLANFRTGDIVVLYPNSLAGDDPTGDQLIKCSITHIDSKSVILRLRARQTNQHYFQKYEFWNLERDLLDSSFMGLSRGLYEWASAPSMRRSKILCKTPPDRSEVMALDFPSDLTEEQVGLCRRIVCAKDYFLLWGPPGTGKTSKMLHHIVKYLLEHTQERLLLMAYTNRAVDEMCESIEQIHEQVRHQYIRIGSRYGAAPEYRERLLDHQAALCGARKDLLELLNAQRIIIGTMASIQGKPELFDLIRFDRLIVDEASQILEPAMAGMMVKFDKILMIGDHLQLPAVVSQDPKYTVVRDKDLQEVGLEDLRDSLFERMFKQAVRHEWDWAYGRLSHQGRMHADIMAFPNERFYGEGLKILPLPIETHFQLVQLSKRQSSGLDSSWRNALSDRRVNFIPTSKDEEHVMGKVNKEEAEWVVQLVKFFQAQYDNGLADIGIITPYRAQIATIKHSLEMEQLLNDAIQVDTVERFQGGAKDIIIISLCANHAHQLRQLVSLSSDGVDRKLNVALTRARKHLVVLGNPEVLIKDERYRDFIEQYQI